MESPAFRSGSGGHGHWMLCRLQDDELIGDVFINGRKDANHGGEKETSGSSSSTSGKAGYGEEN